MNRPAIEFDVNDATVRSRREILELRQLVGQLQLRNIGLSEQLREMQQSTTATAGAISRLQRERDSLHQEVNRLSTDFAAMESQHANLTSLFVAAHQLHATTDRETLINRIEEIVVNFIGSEEFGVYERTAADGLRRIGQVGLPEDLDPAGLPDVTDAVRSGEPYIAADSQSQIAACIPLKIDEKLVGCITIHRLLPHKTAFEPLDLELFDLLKTHAAAALLTTSQSHADRIDS